MLRRMFLLLTFVLFAVPAFASEIYVVVDISDQSMAVRVDGELKYTFDVSTGRKGYSTPTGAYGVTRMYRKYHSKKYDGAPMPHAIFFHGGYAIHGTTDLKRLGKIASHGCVRLHPDNAKALFALVRDIGSDNTHIWVKS
jgi:lipoprotein-anchoring transpeptidase ErfK/SrfK